MDILDNTGLGGGVRWEKLWVGEILTQKSAYFDALSLKKCKFLQFVPKKVKTLSNVSLKIV